MSGKLENTNFDAQRVGKLHGHLAWATGVNLDTQRGAPGHLDTWTQDKKAKARPTLPILKPKARSHVDRGERLGN